MFVRLIKKPNHHVSVRIVENHREGKKVRQKTVCCIGHCHENNTDKITFLQKTGRKLVHEMKNKLQLQLSGKGFEYFELKKDIKNNSLNQEMVHAPSLKEEARLSLGISDIFGKLYDELCFSESFHSLYKKEEVNNLLKEIVLHRLESPSSKRKSVSDIKRKKYKTMDLDRVYRMMDKVYACRETIKQKVCNKTLSLFKQKVDVVFFDVTTLYFESFKPDELRQTGFSKDNKVKETQVVLALMTTKQGLPVGYKLFPGRTYEGGTLIKTIDSLSSQYDVGDISLVADRGMCSKDNLSELQKRGIKFIVGARLRSMKKKIKDEILVKVPPLSKKGFRKIENWTGQYKVDGLNLVVNYSRERAKKDKKEREKFLEKIHSKMKEDKVYLKDLLSCRGVKRYLKLSRKGSKEAFLDKEKIEEEKKWDGLSGVKTNYEDGVPKKILERYRNLWQIEAAFRLNKHDLKMRPIYHWTQRRIKVHILICFLAYGLACYARYYLKAGGVHLSFERIKQELEEVQSSLIKDTHSGKRFILPSKLNPIQTAIYKIFNKYRCQTVQFIHPNS